jgi:hypothetical protein
MSFSNADFIACACVLMGGLFLICIVTLVVAVLVNAGSQPGMDLLDLLMAFFFLPFTMVSLFSAVEVVRLGIRITQRPILSRWGIKVDAVAERWRHTTSQTESGNIHSHYHVKATYVVPSSVWYVQQTTPKQPTSTHEAITPEDATIDEEQEDENEATSEAVDMLVHHKWFFDVSPTLYLTSQSRRKIALVVLPNQPYVVMTEEAANACCGDFGTMLFMSVFALGFGFAGTFLPVLLFLQRTLWIMVPYFCAAVSGLICWLALNWSVFDDMSTSIPEIVTVGGEAPTLTATAAVSVADVTSTTTPSRSVTQESL